MASLGSLPVELVEKIVSSLLVVDEDAPVIGWNALTTDVFAWIAQSSRPLTSSATKIEDVEGVENAENAKDNAEIPVYSLKKLRL